MKTASFQRSKGLAVLLGSCVRHGLVPAALFVALLPTFAQEGPKKPIPKFDISTCVIGDAEIPPLFFLDEKKHFQPLPVASNSRGTPIQIPLIAPVNLYTGTDGARNASDMDVLFPVPAKSTGERWLLVFFQDAGGKLQHIFLDDSVKAHPAGKVRVVNLTAAQVEVSVGGARQSLQQGGDILAEPTPQKDGRFPFRYFIRQQGTPDFLSPIKLLSFRSSDERLLVLFSSFPHLVEDPQIPSNPSPSFHTEFSLSDYRLYDTPPER